VFTSVTNPFPSMLTIFISDINNAEVGSVLVMEMIPSALLPCIVPPPAIVNLPI